jgi:hypothetical protein
LETPPSQNSSLENLGPSSDPPIEIDILLVFVYIGTNFLIHEGATFGKIS